MCTLTSLLWGITGGSDSLIGLLSDRFAGNPWGCVMKVVRVLGLLAPLVLLLAAAPAQAAEPVCLPEAQVCGRLEDGLYVFTIKPPPTTLTVSATVNAAPVTGSLTHQSTPDSVQGWFEPYPALVSGDVFCLTLNAPGVSPGPYCGTQP